MEYIKINNKSFIIKDEYSSIELRNLYIIVNIRDFELINVSDYENCWELYYNDIFIKFSPDYLKGIENLIKIYNISYLSQESINNIIFDKLSLVKFIKEQIDIENKKYKWALTDKQFLTGLLPNNSKEIVYEDDKKYICEFYIENDDYSKIELIVERIKDEFGENILNILSTDYTTHRLLYLKK